MVGKDWKEKTAYRLVSLLAVLRFLNLNFDFCFEYCKKNF